MMNYDEACKFLKDRNFRIDATLQDEYICASWSGYGASYYVRILCPEPESKSPWRVWFKGERRDLYGESLFLGQALADALGLAKVYFNFAVDALHEYPPYAVAEIENLATTIGCSFFRRGADYVLDLAREDLCVVVSGPCYMNEEACNSSEETWTCSYLGVAGTGKTLLEAHQRMTDKIGEFETDL
jgi:hypothetical protein